MASEMVERVARALCGRNRPATVRSAQEWVDKQWPHYVADARAAIEAMREPTEAMLDAAWHSAGESKEMRPRTHQHYRRKFATMIDAALGGSDGTS